MALPVIAVAVLARLLLRGSIVAARKYAAKNGVRISATVLKNARQLNKVKNIKNIRKGNKKPSLPKKKKIDYKAKSAKQKNIQKKMAEKAAKKSEKKKPGFTKITPKHRKKSAIKKDKKSAIKKDKKSTLKKDKKSATKKVDKKSLATKKKTDTKPKTDKKVTTKKTVTTAIKPKPKFKPGFVTGLTVGGAVPYIYNLLTKKKAPPLKPGIDKDKIVPKPKPDAPVKKSIGGTGRGEGALEFARRSKDAAIAKMKEKESRESRKLYQTARPSATFEARVRALVAQKDKLKNVEAGDGRSEYQVRMHKLKKENKKAWKKLFTIGGKLK